MAFTVVPSANSGDVFTEAMWDTYIKDNLNRGVLRPIADILLSEAATSITFTTISGSDHEDLVVYFQGRHNASAVANLEMQFNGDTGGNYDWQYDLSAATSNTCGEGLAQSYLFTGFVSGTASIANSFSASTIYIPNYAETTGQKSAFVNSSYKAGTATADLRSTGVGGHWRNTAAITQILLQVTGGTLIVGTRASLFGVSSV